MQASARAMQNRIQPVGLAQEETDLAADFNDDGNNQFGDQQQEQLKIEAEMKERYIEDMK